MICCFDLFLAWFCSYDFDTVSDVIFDMVLVMILDVGQNCDFEEFFYASLQV